jgi:AcrR family transcriptional regulator
MSKAATRDRILQAALQVFADKGYHRAAVDDIVRASQTSKGAVYHHFPNKEALFLALVDDFSARLAEGVAAAIAGSRGALEKVGAALRAGLETFARHRDLARILLLESVSLGAAYETKRAEVHGRFAALIQSYLDQAVAEGSVPALDTRVATLAWLGAVNEVVIQWLHGDEPDLLDRAVTVLAPMLLRSIGARSSGPARSHGERDAGGRGDRLDGGRSRERLSRDTRGGRTRARRRRAARRRSPRGNRRP